MAKDTFFSACPLDCPDVCSLIVKAENGAITSVQGNPSHPITRGSICSKGRNLLARENNPERIITPLLKRAGVWQPLEWGEALDLFYTKLKEAVDMHGSLSILHAAGDGSAGIIKQRLPGRFFNQLGGVTSPGGSLCWGAGIAAQKEDFGLPASPSWKDLAEAKTILMWGRDPATTNIHLLQYINKARKNGAQVIVINPLTVPSVKFADKHIAPRPGTDGLLALAFAEVIISEKLTDDEYISACVNGYEAFASTALEYTPEAVADVVGIAPEDIRELARIYASSKPASIILGYGLQRFEHGGATIRVIDALAAITGQIGRPGAGIHFANRLWGQFGNELIATDQAQSAREVPWALLAEKLTELDPPIKVLVVERGNPVNQMPDTAKVKSAFAKIPFKVVIDYYHTDTADIADLILPATGNFEEEDLVVSSWNEYIYYKSAIKKQKFSEYGIWQYLAKRFELGDEWDKKHADWLNSVLDVHGLSLESLKEKGFLLNPNANRKAFSDGKFFTASGKIELAGEAVINSMADSVSGLVSELRQGKLLLITPHRRHSLNSQRFHSKESTESNINLRINPVNAKQAGVSEGDLVEVITKVGRLTVLVAIDERVLSGLAVLEQGGWLKDGLGVNLLTESRNTDIGDQAAFYHTFCQVKKVKT